MAKTNTLTIAVVRDNDNNVIAVVQDDPFECGDCEMARTSQVVLTPPDDNGNATLIYDANVLSRHPQIAVGDVWHETFDFKTRFGTSILKQGPFDSPKLENANESQPVHFEQPVIVDPDLFGVIAQVEWGAEC